MSEDDLNNMEPIPWYRRLAPWLVLIGIPASSRSETTERRRSRGEKAGTRARPPRSRITP